MRATAFLSEQVCDRKSLRDFEEREIYLLVKKGSFKPKELARACALTGWS